MTSPSKQRRPAGEGTIYLDKSRGRYVGAITIDGKRRKVVGKTQTETRTRLNKLIAAKTLGATVDDRRITVADVIASFLERDVPNRRSNGRPLAPSTVEVYRWTGQLIVDELGSKKMTALTVRDIEAMLDRLAARKVKPLGDASLRKVLATMQRATSFAERRGEISRNLAANAVVPASSSARERRTSLTPADAQRLLEQLADERNGTMFVLGLRVGLRPGEAAGLHWQDLDADAGLLTVQRAVRMVGPRAVVVEVLKTESSNRTIALPADVVHALAEHRRVQAAERLAASSWNDPRLMFATSTGTVISPPNGRRHLADICQRADVPAVLPNELRHSAASILSDAGAPHQQIADLLGHVNTRMLDQTYRHRVAASVDVAARYDWTRTGDA